MKRLIKDRMSFSIICFTFITVLACGGGEGETREVGDNFEASGETSNPGDEYRRAHVCVLEMNFRTEPSADAPRVKGHEVLYWGVEFDVLAEEGDWVRVRLDDGPEGWLRAEYEGREYISYADMMGAETRMDSDEFLKFASAEAEKWDAGARLSFLCGTDGGLDGKCHTWHAFYKSPAKPGKKLMCMLGDVENEIRLKGYDADGFPVYDDEPAGEPGQELLAEELNGDWIPFGARFDDRLEVAPPPTWWIYYCGGNEVTAQSFVSTRALCNHENADKIVSTAETDIPEDLGVAAEDYEGFLFVVNDNRWEIIVPKGYERNYVFVFGAADGRFIEFRDDYL